MYVLVADISSTCLIQQPEESLTFHAQLSQANYSPGTAWFSSPFSDLTLYAFSFLEHSLGFAGVEHMLQYVCNQHKIILKILPPIIWLSIHPFWISLWYLTWVASHLPLSAFLHCQQLDTYELEDSALDCPGLVQVVEFLPSLVPTMYID